MINKKETAAKSDSRISEMLEVLKKNDIAYGLTPKKLRTILEELDPTFVKLGADSIHAFRPHSIGIL